jgi:UDP-N-acetylglucosamine 2-epimerase (non-hydrolysing)
MLVAGARPNFIKVAPVSRARRARGRFDLTLVHTGQHYDDAMSGAFFRLLDLPEPDVNLNVGSASHAVQTARIMERFEPVLDERRPDSIVVFGDVNSTAACALVAAKLLVPAVHVEAGLRSFDRTMPEEINRIVTDALCDLLLTSEPSGRRNLEAEGRPPASICDVGNVMIDSLERVRPKMEALSPWLEHGLERGRYGFVTLHRPSNVDAPEVLGRVIGCLERIGSELPLVFPVHPRTKTRIEGLGMRSSGALRLTDPVDYLQSLALQAGAAVVFTDSGGVQEEASHLGVPCLTLRPNTERPVTVELGTSTLVGNEPEKIEAGFRAVRSGSYKKSRPIPLWDGRAAERAAAAIEDWLDRRALVPGGRAVERPRV